MDIRIDSEKIRNLEDLAQRLNVSFEFLNQLKQEKVKESYLRRFKLPKKSYPYFREICEIEDQTYKFIIKVLSESFSCNYLPPLEVHGFIRNRSPVTNAKAHLSSKYLLNIDLQNFFANISITAIEKAMLTQGFNPEIAKFLAQICTLNNHLIQGFSTSPVLSNMTMIDLDRDLKIYAENQKIKYTRYADDLSFSSNENFPEFAMIEHLVRKYGFQINQDKVKYQKRGWHQYVTGLTIFDSNYPRIPKKFKKNLRLEIYNLKKNIESFDPKIRELLGGSFTVSRKLKGKIHYLKSVEPLSALKFYNYLESVFKSE